MIDFRVLGPLELKGPDGEDILSILAQPKRVALLAYLALATDQGFRRRDTIIGVFWPDLDQERARGALRKSLYFLRRSLGEEGLRGRGDEEVALDWAKIRCDVVGFERALEKGELEEAQELYRGDLLEGVFLSASSGFERWLDGERERLRESAASSAWRLAHCHLSSGRVSDGERMGQRALSLVPTDEHEVQQFIKALSEAGDRAAAIRFYEKFAKELEDLLDLRPAAETRSLAKEIRNTKGTPFPPVTQGPQEEGPPATTLPPQSQTTDLFSRIREALAHRYTVEREIGKGGMATVFLAEEPKHRRKVALKVLDPELAETLGADRFLREIEIAASLTHPHILPLFDSGEAAGLLYYVMPFAEGESLRSRLEREKQLPVDEAVTIAREVASALAFAHEKGVIHRDVKPANILLEGGQPVLADFGIAQALALAGEARQTRSGVSLGTPAYMSPEQSTGEAELDGRSDQYALGCILYEMLAGDQPFRGPTGESVARQHLTRDALPIGELRPSVPEKIEIALHRALEKAPADRFSTLRGFSDALAAEAPSPPARARSLTGRTRSKGTRPGRGRHRLWGVGILGLAIITAAVYFLGKPWGDPEPVSSPDGEVVLAIMPFAVSGSGQTQGLSEGMATLLGFGLDPVRGMRTVDRNGLFPRVGQLEPGDRIPLTEAQQVSQDFGATHFILGEVVGAGEERLTIAVTPYSSVPLSEETPVSVTVEGSRSDLNALADSLAARVLPYLPVAPQERLSGIAAVTTDSDLGWAAYQKGEEEFRATRYAEAFASFAEAVDEDPTFALAHYRHSLTAVMILRFDEAPLSAAEAQEHSVRLNTREQRLVRAWASLVEGSAIDAELQYRAILSDYPDEVEAHFGLGAAQIYFNPVLGESVSESEPHFREVLALSPNFGQARFHLLEFATRRRDGGVFDSLLAGVDPESDQALAWDAVRAFWRGGPQERRGIEDRIRGSDPVAVGLAVGRVAAFLRDYPAAENLASLLTGSDRDEETRCAAHLLMAMTRFAQGRWRDGMASLESAGEYSNAWATELRALFTGFPLRTPSSDELDAVKGELLTWNPEKEGLSTNFVLFAHNGFHGYLRTYLLAMTSVWAGELEAARGYADELRTMPSSSDRLAVTAAWAQGIRARVFAAEGQEARAATSLRSVRVDVNLWLISLSPFFSRSFDRFALGQLLRRTGDQEGALAWFQTLTEGHELVLVGPAHLQMAQIFEERGDTAAAAAHYDIFLGLWNEADPEFQHFIEEARTKVLNLTRKP